MNNQYNGEFDEFDVPTGMWDKIEDGLNEHDKKKRGIIWWRVAGVAVILLGIGAVLTYTNITTEIPVAAENNTSQSEEDAVVENNTTTDEQTTGANDNEEHPNVAMTGHDSVHTSATGQEKLPPITTVVPFTTIQPDPRSETMTTQEVTISNVTANLTVANLTPGISITQKEIQRIPSVGGEPDIANYLSVVPGVTTTKSNELYSVANGNYDENLSWGAISTRISERQREPRKGYAPEINYFTEETPSDQLQLSSGYMDGTTQTNFDSDGRIQLNVVGEIGDKLKFGETNVDLIAASQKGTGESQDLWISQRESGEWIEPVNNSHYDEFVENDFIRTDAAPLSTFSIDVDGASYSDVRGMINRGTLPNPNAVRIEEFINYFPYEYEEPKGEHPFSMHSEVANCPWNAEHKLMKIGIKGQSIDKAQLPKNNLVFLLDVSGSMDNPEKLDLLKKGFKLLVRELREEDRVAICVYAGAAGVVLPSTSGANKDIILDALNKLSAGGSTAGGEGIELAYALAEENFRKDGNNRVILATDGDFNVGVSKDEKLVELIEEKRESGVFLTVLGFGHDNFQSSKMEKLANNGNGNFSYIDNILEAKKVLVTEMGATLQAIAKDVKIQMEFNPGLVAGYRLIGYENRLLRNEDFANDSIDAGELGAGHTVTAIYEIIPTQSEEAAASSENNLKYSEIKYTAQGGHPNEYATIKFRYKAPDGDKSQLIEEIVSINADKETTEDLFFIQAVTEFGLILRQSKYYTEYASFDRVLENARMGRGADPFGYRSEFIRIVEKTQMIWNGGDVD